MKKKIIKKLNPSERRFIISEIKSIKLGLKNLKPRLKEGATLDKVLDMEKRLLKIEKLVFVKLS